MASRLVWRVGIMLVLAVLAWTLAADAWAKRDEQERVNPDDAFQEHRRAALVVALATPLVLFVGVLLRLDGFALGSIAVAVGLETFLFVGWIGSPQHEPDRYFFVGSTLPLTLIVATLLFNYLQKEA